MQRVLSTYLFVQRKLGPDALREIAHAGIPAIELFCARAHFDYRSLQETRELAGWLSRSRLTLHSVHAPTDRDLSSQRESGVPLSICDPEPVRRRDAVDEVKRALDLAELVPYRFLVQHVGHSRDRVDPRKWDAAFTSLEHLMIFAKQRGVAIALENTPGELATPENLRQFIRDTRLNDLRLCLDTGHAHMEGGVARAIEAMRDFMVTTHIHDNRGEKDEHLLPYDGTIDWDAALKSLPGGVPMVLELRDGSVPAVEKVAAVFGKLEQTMAAKA